MTTSTVGVGLLILTAILFWACYPRGGRVAPFLDGRINLQTYMGLFLTVGLFGGFLLLLYGATQ
jgi:hypothetical protein